MADYSVQIVDLNGNARAFIDVLNLKLTPVINGAMTCAFDVVQTDPNAVELAILSRAVKVYRNGVLVFHGPIVPPLVDKFDVVSVSAADALWYMQNRFVQLDISYNAEDAGAIAWDRVAAENLRMTTRLQEGSIASSVPRAIAWSAGKNEAEIIHDLATMVSGFYYRVDPVDGVPGIMGELVILYPDSGVAKPQVCFEYGDDTIDNLAPDFQLSWGLPVNHIRATGSGTGSVQPVALVDDTTSQSTLGAIVDQEQSFTDLVDVPSLTAHADGLLLGTPPLTFTGSSAPAGAVGSPPVPLPWDDFAVGDMPQFRFRFGRLDIGQQVRVTAFTVQVDDMGDTETLTNLTLETLGLGV